MDTQEVMEEYCAEQIEHAFVAKSCVDPETCECGADIKDPIHQLLLPLVMD